MAALCPLLLDLGLKSCCIYPWPIFAFTWSSNADLKTYKNMCASYHLCNLERNMYTYINYI